MSILRIHRRRHPYAQIDNRALDDKKLSLKATGLLAYLLSLPDDWEIHVKEVVRHHTDGTVAHYAALKELRERGYVRMKIVRTEGGEKIKGTVWNVHEEPLHRGFCNTGSCTQEIATITNTNRNKEHTNARGEGAPGARSPSFGVNGARNGPSTHLVSIFTKFSVQHRLFKGKQGSTKVGWTPRVIENWRRCCDDLLEQVDASKVEKVLAWYIDHWRDDYVPQCYTMRRFCDRFQDVLRAMRRQNNGHNHHRPKMGTKTVWVNGEEYDVTEYRD